MRYVVIHLSNLLTVFGNLLAPDFKSVQQEVFDILDKKVLVGHAIQNDLKVNYHGDVVSTGVQTPSHL